MISTQLFKKIKPLIFFAIFLPSLFWSYQFINGALGVNPIEKLMDNKLLTIRAAENVVRILPPLNVKKNELDEALKIINKVCSKFK